MIDRDDVYREEWLFHKPTEKKKKPKKANHKHHYEYCVFETIKEHGRLDPAHGFMPTTELTIGTYCPVCGKIGDLCVYGEERWYKQDAASHHYSRMNEPTTECLNELDPQTRTLPFFRIEDFWQKEVQLNG